MKLKQIVCAALLAGAAAVPSTASATIVINSYAGDPGFRSGNITLASEGINQNVGIGRFNLIGTEQPGGAPVDFLTYCIDILHHIQAGSYEIMPLSTLVSDATKRAQLHALLSTADPFIQSAATTAEKYDISAAIQLAVWEITYEAGTSGYSLSTGDFRSSGGNSGAARTLAAGYLGNVAGNVWSPAANTRIDLLYSPTNQSQVMITPVPEPATWAMMIAGFGLVGGALRARRRAPQPAQA